MNPFGPPLNLEEIVVYGLQGTGGCARSIMPLLASRIRMAESGTSQSELYVFIEPSPTAQTVNSFPVVSEDEFLALDCFKKFFNVGIADSKIRERLYSRYTECGIDTFSLHANLSTIFIESTIGDGAIICPYTAITANVTIGRMFHLNLYSYVEHDCEIGDFVTFAPGVKCNGNVRIGNHAYIGSGAILKQGSPDKPLIIGEGAIIGMGAVVTKDVPPFTTVVGNPARPLSVRA